MTIKNFVYSVLNWITFKKGISRNINGFKIRFTPQWSRYFPGDYEKENYAWLKQQLKTGDQVIDIGAHIGLFSVVCSQLVGKEGKIVCFEPTPGTYKLLQQTLKLNHCENVIPVQAAVSSKEGQATFYISTENEGNNSNSLVGNNTLQKMEGYDVQLKTIDSIVAEYVISPNLIKIDVEGAELDTLKGGLNTFSTLKPNIILGLHPEAIKRKGDSLEQIWDLLVNASYEICLAVTCEDEKSGTKLAKEDFCRRELLFDVQCY